MAFLRIFGGGKLRKPAGQVNWERGNHPALCRQFQSIETGACFAVLRFLRKRRVSFFSQENFWSRRKI